MPAKLRAELITLTICFVVLALFMAMMTTSWGFTAGIIILLIGGFVVFVVANLVLYDLVYKKVLHRVEMWDIKHDR